MAIQRDWVVLLQRRLQDALGSAGYLEAVDQGLDRLIGRLGELEQMGAMSPATLNQGLNLTSALRDRLERATTVAAVRDAFFAAQPLLDLLEEALAAAAQMQGR